MRAAVLSIDVHYSIIPRDALSVSFSFVDERNFKISYCQVWKDCARFPTKLSGLTAGAT
jgi:hypothetical protein